MALSVTWLIARQWVRHAGYALTDTAIFFRSGWLSRRVSVVRFDKMQTVTLRESPFDRRNRMASIVVDTAGAGNIGHRIDIPYLDVEVAKSVLRRLYAEVSTTEFRW
jgi:putative membrane protein